jgi:hypothetical protein
MDIIEAPFNKNTDKNIIVYVTLGLLLSNLLLGLTTDSSARGRSVC